MSFLRHNFSFLLYTFDFYVIILTSYITNDTRLLKYMSVKCVNIIFLKKNKCIRDQIPSENQRTNVTYDQHFNLTHKI